MAKIIKYLFMALLTLSFIISPSSAYTETGTIYDNGDDTWDDGEIDFIRYDIDADETFNITVSSTSEIEVWLCDCSNEQDINDIVNDVYNDGSSPNLYIWVDSYTPDLESGSYTPSSRKYLNVAIFTIYDTGTMSYSLTVSIPSGSRFGSSSFDFTWLIILIIVIGAALLYRKSKSKKPQTYNPTYNPGFSQQVYQPPGYQQKSYSSYSPQVKTPQAAFCANCGTKNTSKFCMNCGEKMDYS